MRQTYEILEGRLETAEALIVKANKRASKVGASPISMKVLRTFDKPYNRINDDGTTTHFVVRYAEVEIEGETPKFAGWEFLAALDHSHETGTVVRAVPGATVPEKYWSALPACDHCQENRRRKDTYVVQHEDGTIKQVGSTCIQDFLGGQDPQVAISNLNTWNTICGFFNSEDGAYDGPCSRGELRVGTLNFLQAAVADIRINGFLGTAKARETEKESSSQRIASYFFPVEGEERRAKEFWGTITDKDIEDAKSLIEWASTLQIRIDDSFLNNVKIVCGSTSLQRRDFGIAAASVTAYNREVSRRLELSREATVSQYVGEIGKRDVFTLTLVALKSWQSDYGVTHFHKFLDASGNVVIWFGSTTLLIDGPEFTCPLEVGQSVTVKASVKAHNEREGVKQTIVTRVAVHVPKVKKVRTKSENVPTIDPNTVKSV